MFAQTVRVIASRRAPVALRAFSNTPSVSLQDPKKPNSERHAMHKAKKSMEGGLDNQSASVQAGLKAADSGKASETYDAAMSSKGGQAKHSELKEEALQNANTDNEKAQSGSFMAQVGGQPDGKPSGSVGGKEEATPPGIMAAAKNALGLGTSKKEHEDNKTAGGGSYRSLHTSARRMGDASDGAKEDGAGSRTPVDGGVVGDQNPHLKHKRPEEEDMGKGNAATDPHLPSSSAKRAATDQHSDQQSQQKARMHTSARQSSHRSLHTSARRMGDADPKAKTPVDGGVVGTTNPELKSKRPEQEKMGYGNSPTDTPLPSSSHKRAALDQHSDQESQQKARMHTSARQSAAKPAAGYVDAAVPEPKQAGYDAPRSSSSFSSGR